MSKWNAQKEQAKKLVPLKDRLAAKARRAFAREGNTETRTLHERLIAMGHTYLAKGGDE